MNTMILAERKNTFVFVIQKPIVKHMIALRIPKLL